MNTTAAAISRQRRIWMSRSSSGGAGGLNLPAEGFSYIVRPSGFADGGQRNTRDRSLGLPPVRLGQIHESRNRAAVRQLDGDLEILKMTLNLVGAEDGLQLRAMVRHGGQPAPGV